MIQIDFLSTLKELQLMLFEMFYRRQIYLVVSSIFHRTCGSISNVLDYKNVTWTNHNLVYSYVWLLYLAIIPRCAPLFPIVYGACSIEPLKSFHEQIIISRLGKIIPSKCFIHSSNVLEVLAALLREERIVRVRMLQNQPGYAPDPQRRRYVDCNARILRIADDYPNRQVMDYLRHIVHNLFFKIFTQILSH